jgi:ABC-type uncharacterized transport system involved in gliding motility auxiliary subunit
MPPERAEFQYAFSVFVNIVLVPLFIVGFGLIRWFLRRRRET